MKQEKKIFEIIFHARGGQGAKTAAEVLAQAGVSQGKYVQAFPHFGPERSGAPTITYTRISDEPIRIKEPIVDPDLVVVLDRTLLDSVTVTKNLDKDEILIVNTQKEPWEVRNLLGAKEGVDKNFEGKIFSIDASGISQEIIGQVRPNTVILGKIVQISEIVKLENVVSEFEKIFLKKIGKEITKKNVAAIEKAYDSI